MIFITRFTSFIAFLSLLFIGHVALAQERTAVILPTDVQYNNSEMITSLRFNGMPPLPKNCFLKGEDEKMLLHLAVKENKLPDNKTCYIRLENQANEQIASLQIKKGGLAKSIVSFEIPVEEFEKLKNGTLDLNLKYQPDCFELTTTPLITFFGNKKLNDTITLNNQPKLAVNYELSAKPHRSDWSQPYGDAQQSGSLDWTLDFRNGLTKEKGEKLNRINYGNADKGSIRIMDKLNIYDGHPITYDKNSEEIIITSWATNMGLINGKQWGKTGILWSSTIKQAAPRQLPLIDENGLMYYFSGGNDPKTMMVVLDLKENGKVKDTKNLNDIALGNGKMGIVENTITMGYDGSLYFPTNTGVVALTAYPELKPKWYYNAIGSFSPVSLSEDERMACFIQKIGNQTELCVIDNITGRKLGSREFVGSYMRDGLNDIPPILIQTIETGECNVFFLDDSKASKVLHSFKISYSSIFSIEPNNFEKLKNNAFRPQPILGPKKKEVYVQEGNSIFIYAPEGSISEIYEYSKNIYKNVYKGVYFDGISLYVQPSDNKYMPDRLIARGIPFYEIQDVKHTVFSPDGTFYTIQDNGELRRYFPISDISKDPNPLKLDQLNSKTTYAHHKKIELTKQTVSSATNAILWSKEFVFQNGFTVIKGAEITFKHIKEFY